MANVIALKSRPRPSMPREAAGHSAEIVIFPGVRYEYHEEPPARANRRRTEKRDVLELAD